MESGFQPSAWGTKAAGLPRMASPPAVGLNNHRVPTKETAPRRLSTRGLCSHSLLGCRHRLCMLQTRHQIGTAPFQSACSV